MLELRDGTKKSWQASLTHTGLHKTQTRWLVHSWSTFGAKTSHEQHGHTRLTTAQTWGSHHLPLIVYYAPLHGAHIQMAFLSRDSRMGVPKSRQLGLPQLWSPITLRTNLGSRCGLKKSCIPRQELSNGMSHVIYKQVNRVDSWLFLIRSQTGNLTPSPSFGHNLCFRCPNEQCEPILDIYVPKAFQWYKERQKPLSFDPSNFSLKFWKSIRIPSPKVGVALGVWRFTPESMWCDSRAFSWPAPL